ncbi:MAG: hypothetical protein JWN70_2074 [Planctomycetaceae bacterium]|nr:hypothetical protein [Planctomycetaceae bacterium]
MPPAVAELELVLGSAGASPSHETENFGAPQFARLWRVRLQSQTNSFSTTFPAGSAIGISSCPSMPYFWVESISSKSRKV